MTRTTCATIADFFTARHREAGVEFRFDSSVTRLTGQSRVTGVELDDGSHIECDMVIVAIGIEANTSLADSAGLAIDNGIAVDACGRTQAPTIFSAGDCTSHPHPWVGQRIRLESVQNAIEQGKAVAAAIIGESKPFAAVPWFWSDQYAFKLQIAGLSLGYDDTVTRGNPDDGSFSVYYFNRDNVVAVDCINDPKSFVAARNLLLKKPSWPKAAIADIDCDLAAL